MAFCASWQLPKFLFQGSDSEQNVMVTVLFVLFAKLVLYELLF